MDLLDTFGHMDGCAHCALVAERADREFLFDDLESSVANALNDRWQKEAVPEINRIYAAAIEPGRADLGKIDEATYAASRVSRSIWGGKWLEGFKNLIGRIVGRGEARVGQGLLNDSVTKEQVVEGIVASTLYYGNNFFDNQVVPAIIKEIDKILGGLNPNDPPNLQPILKVLNDRLKSVPYWRVVANAAASRGFHYGYLKAARAQGFLTYQFTAVIDDRTSEICNHFAGQTFQIATALQVYERVALAQNPEDVKDIHPWFQRDSSVPISQDAERYKQNGGVPVPPLHGNCRSTITPI